jgi:hypothetical protein
MPVGLLEPLSGTNMTPLAKLPGGGQAEVGNDKVWNLARPEIDSGSYAYWAGRLGPRGAENWKNEQLAPWKGEVAAYLSDQLLTGRPKDKSLSWDEVSGLVQHVAPQLAGDKQFMGRIGLWAKMFNDEIAAQREADFKRAENMYKSGNEQNALMTDPERHFIYDRAGLYSRAPGQAFATAPGLGEPAPASQEKSSTKKNLFTGWLPGPAQRKAEEIQVTAQPSAWKAGLEARARQGEQTRGHAVRRKFDQLHPAGSWVTQTNPETGKQTRVWTGQQQEVDLGRNPESAGDMYATVLSKYLQGGRAALNDNEWTYLQSRMAADKGDLMQKLGALFGPGPGIAGPAASSAKPPSPAMRAAMQPEEDEKPPLPGARKDRYGKWWVKKDGKWFTVEP